MKTLVIIRHGRKDEDGTLVDKDQLAEIENIGIAGLNDLVKKHQGLVIFHLGTAIERTGQTIKAYERHLDISNAINSFGGYLPADARLGSNKIFKEFSENPEIVKEAERTTWFNAFRRYNPKFIEKIQINMLDAITDIFSRVDDGSLVISAGHTPMIEWLALGIDENDHKISCKIKLKELTGFIFTEDKGRIQVTRTIGF
ncbi:MAG: hypothetical protein WC719_03815 [Patescibacteria group bacterium]|jgi:hypothetical protein